MWNRSAFRHKQQSQGTGRIFKLAPSNNNNHPHTSASEGESNLFASDIEKNLIFFFSFPFHFLQRACFVPWPAGGWANTRAAFCSNRSCRSRGQFIWKVIPHCMGVPCFIPLTVMKWVSNKTAFKHQETKTKTVNLQLSHSNFYFRKFTLQLIKTNKLWSAALQLLFTTTSLQNPYIMFSFKADPTHDFMLDSSNKRGWVSWGHTHCGFPFLTVPKRLSHREWSARRSDGSTYDVISPGLIQSRHYWKVSRCVNHTLSSSCIF